MGSGHRFLPADRDEEDFQRQRAQGLAIRATTSYTAPAELLAGGVFPEVRSRSVAATS